MRHHRILLGAPDAHLNVIWQGLASTPPPDKSHPHVAISQVCASKHNHDAPEVGQSYHSHPKSQTTMFINDLEESSSLLAKRHIGRA